MTVRALRHYEEIDLLSPEIVNRDTGYRYYSVGQLQKVFSITKLKSMGYSLPAITVASHRTASANPARFMKVYDRTGSLEAGKDADIVIFDEDIRVKRTIVRGRTVFK